MAEANTPKMNKGMKGRGGLIMLAVFVVLCIWLFFDLKKPVREADAPPPMSDYVSISADDVARAEVKREDGGFMLVRQGDQWMFEAPRKMRADTEKVNSWLKSLLDDAKVNRSVEGKAADPSSYGLNPPSAQLVLTARGGGTKTLQIGKDFRTSKEGGPGNIFYAREAKDGRLFMLDSTLVKDVKDKKADDFRDKRLLDVKDEKEVTRIVLTREGGTTELQRQGADQWQVVQPFRAPADKLEVDGLLGQIKSAQADSVEEKPKSPAEYGLDKPRVVVQVADKQGTHEVRFGKEAKGGKVYAGHTGDPDVELVAKSTFDLLDKKPADLRDRKLISLDSEKINTVELHNQHGTVRLQKTASSDPNKAWEIANAPDPKHKQAKGDEAQRIVNTVTGSAYRHVEEAPADLAKYGLDKPQITVQVSNGKATQILLIGKKTKEGNFFAKGAPNAVFEVQPFVVTDLDVKPDAFKQ